jgi:hypothetical protein
MRFNVSKPFIFDSSSEYLRKNEEVCMYSIEFARIEDGYYEIIEENDERLFCIGQILLDDDLRAGVKKLLEYAPELGVERHKDFETQIYKMRLSPDPVRGLLIKFVNKEHPDHILETDIQVETLSDLIDSWEAAVDQEPESITITRSQDTFTLEVE